MKVLHTALAVVLLTAIGIQAQAGVIIGGTRVIYDGGKKESSINISNPDKTPFLVQSWVDSNEGDAVKSPFVITPPLFRLDSGQNNLLRIVKVNNSLPEDKESLYWLNIKSIPSSVRRENTLQIAVKTRIKLIYRPQGLNITLEEAAKNLKWKRVGNLLQVTNSSPYYITFFNIKYNGSVVKDAKMIAPKSSASYALPSAETNGVLNWQYINDYGGTGKVFSNNL
jgi:P pilus assembly chaperone PapD